MFIKNFFKKAVKNKYFTIFKSWTCCEWVFFTNHVKAIKNQAISKQKKTQNCSKTGL